MIVVHEWESLLKTKGKKKKKKDIDMEMVLFPNINLFRGKIDIL